MAPVRSIHSHQSTPTQPSTSSHDSAQQPSTSAQPTTITQPSTSTQPSSSHSMQISPVDNTLSARQQRRQRATEKPIAILAYNKGKSGIEKSNQMASCATSLRKGLKWYRKLAIELLLRVAVVNAWTLYGKASQKKIKIRSFKKELADSLLKLSSNNSEQLRSPSMRMSATHHLITRVNAAEKPMRRFVVLATRKSKKRKVAKWLKKLSNRQTLTVTDVLVNHKCSPLLQCTTSVAIFVA